MNKQAGMTLIEIIIYVAILGFVATAFMTMSINIISLNNKSVAQQELASNLRYVTERINYEIKNAKSISSTTASSLTLTSRDSSRSPTVFDLNSGNIRMGFGVGGSCPASAPCVLDSNLINISAFTVTNMSSGDSSTQNIEYSITANYINPSGRSEFNAASTVSSSQEIRSP